MLHPFRELSELDPVVPIAIAMFLTLLIGIGWMILAANNWMRHIGAYCSEPERIAALAGKAFWIFSGGAALICCAQMYRDSNAWAAGVCSTVSVLCEYPIWPATVALVVAVVYFAEST
jgi:hypothetical protein